MICSNGTQYSLYSTVSLGLQVIGPHGTPSSYIILTPGQPVIFCGFHLILSVKQAATATNFSSLWYGPVGGLNPRPPTLQTDTLPTRSYGLVGIRCQITFTQFTVLRNTREQFWHHSILVLPLIVVQSNNRVLISANQTHETLLKQLNSFPPSYSNLVIPVVFSFNSCGTSSPGKASGRVPERSTCQ